MGTSQLFQEGEKMLTPVVGMGIEYRITGLLTWEPAVAAGHRAIAETTSHLVNHVQGECVYACRRVLQHAAPRGVDFRAGRCCNKYQWLQPGAHICGVTRHCMTTYTVGLTGSRYPACISGRMFQVAAGSPAINYLTAGPPGIRVSGYCVQ